MPKFTYKFEKVLKIKSDLEEQIKQVYAFHVQKKAALLNENEAMQSNYYENKSDYLETLKPGDRISITDLQSAEDYGLAVQIRIKNNLDIVSKLDVQIEKLAKELQKATAERKMFEKLKEKAYAQYMKEQNYLEGKESDEIASNKYYETHIKEAR